MCEPVPLTPVPDGGWIGAPGWIGWPNLIFPYTKLITLNACPSIDTGDKIDRTYGCIGTNYYVTCFAGWKTLNESQVQSPASTYMTFDSGVFYLGWWQALAPDSWCNYLPGSGASGINGSVVYSGLQSDFMNGRHNGGIVVSFCDGHVKWLKPDVMLSEARKAQNGQPNNWTPWNNQ